MSPIPDNVVDKVLYGNIKKEIHQELKKKNVRWGAYSSSLLVARYKKAGGRYISISISSSSSSSSPEKSKEKKKVVVGENDLKRWFEEVWIDICRSKPPGKIVACGRSSPDYVANKPIGVCRPLHRVSSKTPKTYYELTEEERKRACRKKHENPTKRYLF